MGVGKSESESMARRARMVQWLEYCTEDSGTSGSGTAMAQMFYLALG